ncbi:tetratricopeptide repeat protein [Patiriisocius hiemis]|uniref:Tetratricopeptide repeat protein n=1 Tax=Patiriisocius hiemis TaxID=3075604 RepID=A0ABU2YGX9_9FLAO|nr:hypothetical protein [Constantimarinum sp. W242]MDT0556318.1 hypothetical protein [Constantimarinum sp. W242]
MNNKSNIPEKTFETIERYLLKKMTTEESVAFKSSLETDTALQQQVEEVKSIIHGIEEASLKEKMEVFHSEMETNTPLQKKKSSYYFYAIAAVFLGAIGLFFFFNQESTNEKLFAEHFTPDPGLPTTMSTTSNYLFFEGMVDYKMANYQNALTKWNQLHALKPENDTLNYFIGVAQLASDNEKDAITFLQKTITKKESLFISDAYLYLGLAHLKAGERDTAKEFLKLSSSEKSLQILKEIKNE